ncbi:hypothetical protein [Archaeoglobus sulfaticallidus]|uniref:hypothetical protein n=1 Tax=Archaeoglobus sulfaticallidus TaxID=1316941 RepID=UPI00064ED9C9|nr:hypothetical protein [Archaeoglobus sulfaticallidus]
MPFFFDNKPLPDPHTWKENLMRWAEKVGLDSRGLGCQDDEEDLGKLADVLLSGKKDRNHTEHTPF